MFLRAAALMVAAPVALAAFGWHSPPPAPLPPADPPRVKLAVLVVFDQLRGDLLTRWLPQFGRGGFSRLLTEGAWFTRCYYPYGTTTTGPGHASMLTGTCPDRHGIVNNNWYEGGDAYCAGSDRYALVPPLRVWGDEKKDGKPKAVGTPDRLLSETVADVLKATGRGKVFGLSLKDRSAILPTGKRPDGAFWFDGHFLTSTYYADRVPEWVEAFNRSGAAEKWLNVEWTQFRPDIDYDALAGPDDGPGEGKGSAQGTTFPHPMNAGKPELSKGYYNALANSPFGNDLLLEFAKACVTAEGLGAGDDPDLLVVSFSSNDLIGHTWGPDSHEVLDVTLRSDRLMADFLTFLDAKVGRGRYAIAMTADHGVSPLVRHAAAHGLDAKPIPPAKLGEACEKHLAATFGTFKPKDAPKGEKVKTSWLEAVTVPWVYLNPRLVAASGKRREDVARELAEFIRKQPGIARVFTREELAGEFPPDDVVGRRVKRSYHPARCGDVYVVAKPYHLFAKPEDTGTTHGAPYNYDAHVPLVVFGPGVRGGPNAERTTPQAAAATLAHFLGVRPPKDAEFPVPATLWK